MKFFFHNNLKSHDILEDTFKDICPILNIENDIVVINNNKMSGITISFNSSIDSVIKAITLNSSILNKNNIDKYFINTTYTQKNNSVYIILPFKINTT